MRRFSRANRLSLALAVLLAAALGAALTLSGPASASAALIVSPNSGLTSGQSVTVTGSGYDASSTGAVLECNNASGQPTIAVLGNSIPVSCTNPLNSLHTTDASGNLSTTFTIVTGVTGPPGTGTDSSGGDAATDAAGYPCPPTPAQITAGVSCTIAYGDQGGAQASSLISFGGGTTTTTSGGTTTTTAQSTTTTTAPTTTTTAPTTTTTAAQLPGFLTVVAGQPTMIQGAGFTVGESVSSDIHSTAIHLAVFTTNTLGIAIGTVTIPINTVVGYHEIFLTGATSGHVDIIRAWIIQGSTQAVTAASTTGTPAPGSPASSPSTAAGTCDPTHRVTGVHRGGPGVVGDARRWAAPVESRLPGHDDVLSSARPRPPRTSAR